jgi:hypothetical protein
MTGEMCTTALRMVSVTSCRTTGPGTAASCRSVPHGRPPGTSGVRRRTPFELRSGLDGTDERGAEPPSLCGLLDQHDGHSTGVSASKASST